MDLKGTQTEKNLMAAFAGESQAHTKYLYYASQAKGRGSQNRSQTKDEKHQHVEVLPQETNAGVKPSIRRLQKRKIPLWKAPPE